MDSEQVNIKIGNRIKNLRQELGLTQQELADRTELTKGYISQLERGQVAPSIVTLMDLIECLGTTASEFFAEHDEQIVFHKESFFEKIDEDGNSIEWIVPTAQRNEMEPLLVDIRPHSRLPEDKPHAGEEFGYLISGRLKLHLGDKTYTVKSGESFYYEAKTSHWIENPSSKSARLIWVSTPPTF